MIKGLKVLPLILSAAAIPPNKASAQIAPNAAPAIDRPRMQTMHIDPLANTISAKELQKAIEKFSKMNPDEAEYLRMLAIHAVRDGNPMVINEKLREDLGVMSKNPQVFRAFVDFLQCARAQEIFKTIKQLNANDKAKLEVAAKNFIVTKEGVEFINALKDAGIDVGNPPETDWVTMIVYAAIAISVLAGLGGFARHYIHIPLPGRTSAPRSQEVDEEPRLKSDPSGKHERVEIFSDGSDSLGN